MIILNLKDGLPANPYYVRDIYYGSRVYVYDGRLYWYVNTKLQEIKNERALFTQLNATEKNSAPKNEISDL